MNNKQRLDAIQDNFDSMGSVDKDWLISRVKTLTAALERINVTELPENSLFAEDTIISIQSVATLALTDGES